MNAPKFHILDGFPKSVSPSSHASEADGFVFLTGQFGRDLDDPAKPLPDGIRAQTERTLGNMRRVLEGLVARGWALRSTAASPNACGTVSSSMRACRNIRSWQSRC